MGKKSTGHFPTAIDVENPPRKKQAKADGWTNVLTGLGRRGKDRSVSNKIDTYVPLLSTQELEAMYLSDGPATRIVDSVAEDMTRNGWRIAGDDERETLYKEGEKIHLTAHVTQALKWQRLFGGALLVRIYDKDFADLSKPVRAGAKVVGLKVYGAPSVDLTATTFGSDPRRPFYEEAEVFSVRKKYGGEYKIHASRCEVLKGRELPVTPNSNLTLEQKYWGQSELQAPAVALGIFGAFVQGIGHAGQEMAVSKYKLGNLMQILAENSSDALYARMESIELSKSLINAVLLGKDEEWGRDQLSFVGLPEVFDRLAMLVSGSCGVPVTKLFGRSAAGLNSTGEGDSRDYYDMINSQQISRLGPLLTRVYSGIQGVVTDHEILFVPAWSPSQQELIKMRNTQAITDKTYVEMGVLKPEEIRNSRFDGGYSFETVIRGGMPAPVIEGTT